MLYYSKWQLLKCDDMNISMGGNIVDRADRGRTYDCELDVMDVSWWFMQGMELFGGSRERDIASNTFV